MRPYRLTVLLLLLVACSAAQELYAQSVQSVVVPVVGSVWGNGGARWMTDLQLINDTGHEVDVALELVSAPDAPAMVLTLASGQVQQFDDIIGQAFGLDLALSPLRITTSGRRSVSVRATVYATRGAERSALQPIAVYSSQSPYPTVILDGLAFSDGFRTNIGLVNLGTHPVQFALALQRLPGRNIAVTSFTVGAGSILHTSIQSLFPLITQGNDFSVVVESGSAETCVYASVIDNARDAGRFIEPRIGLH